MTNEDFVDWKQDSRTQEVFNIIKTAKQVYQEQMVDPMLVTDPNMSTICARYIGIIEGLNYLLNVDIENEVSSNEEQSESDYE